VREGSGSQALFGARDHFFWVKVGTEVAAGLKLIDVRTDRVIFEEKGTGDEIEVLLRSDEAPTRRAAAQPTRQAEAGPSPEPPKSLAREVRSMTPQELERLNEEIKAQFERGRTQKAEGGNRGTTAE
jgi:hypothetical protein